MSAASDPAGFPDCFLPESAGDVSPDPVDQELVVEELADEAKLPKILAFPQEAPPRFTEREAAAGAVGGEEFEVLQAEDFPEEYAVAFGDAKTRLTGLISGFEGEKREASRRLEQIQLSAETLRFHLERMERVQTASLPRTRLIRELERGLVALDAAERDLEMELSATGLRPGRASREMPSSILHDWLVNGKTFALLQIVAFFLPLLAFAIIALILIGTALGWF